MIDAPTERPWGVRIELVELRDIALPESMKRSMSRQAEAERERRARVIAADGERQASEQLSAAAAAMAGTPGALHLRLLQTVADVAVEKNSTLVMPFPVELLRLFAQTNETGVAALGTAPAGNGVASDEHRGIHAQRCAAGRRRGRGGPAARDRVRRPLRLWHGPCSRGPQLQ